MNVYLLLAIAFGAMTGAGEAPVVRPSVVLSRAGGEGSQIAREEILRSAQDDGWTHSCRGPVRVAPIAIAESPLTGAATPRAPATIG